jgi:hypothetical protein
VGGGMVAVGLEVGVRDARMGSAKASRLFPRVKIASKLRVNRLAIARKPTTSQSWLVFLFIKATIPYGWGDVNDGCQIGGGGSVLPLIDLIGIHFDKAAHPC